MWDISWRSYMGRTTGWRSYIGRTTLHASPAHMRASQETSYVCTKLHGRCKCRQGAHWSQETSGRENKGTERRARASSVPSPPRPASWVHVLVNKTLKPCRVCEASKLLRLPRQQNHAGIRPRSATQALFWVPIDRLPRKGRQRPQHRGQEAAPRCTCLASTEKLQSRPEATP